MRNQPFHTHRGYVQRVTVVLLAIAIALAPGCARHPVKPEPVVMPEVPETGYQSSLGRVALVVRVSLPELEFMRVARDQNLVRGNTRPCGVTGTSGATLVASVLFCLVADPVVRSDEESKAKSANSADAVVAPILDVSSMKDGLRDAIMSAAKADGIKLVSTQLTVDEEGEPDYRRLASKGVDTVLEVVLAQVFPEPERDVHGRVKLDPELTLDMRAYVSLRKTRDNSATYLGGYSFHGKRYTYKEWAASNGDRLVNGLKKGYVSLGRDISDRVFLLYPFANRLGEGEPEYCGLGALGPKDNLADDLSPLLSWQSFPRASDLSMAPQEMKRVKNIRYELVVGTGDNEETPDVFYHVDKLTNTSHRLPMRLEPDTRYFWSVRARFELDGRKRVTDWATYCPFGRQLVVGGSIYRFYTPEG